VRLEGCRRAKRDLREFREDGVTTEQSAETRERRRRVRLLEQENEVLGRAAAYLSRATPCRKRVYHASER
jgi:transposase-like protein